MIGGMPSSATSVPLSTVRVLIVEDQMVIRELLAQFLETSPCFSVVGQAADVDEALRLTTEHRPQIVVLDWMLANGTGLRFLREGLSGPQPPRVLVFSGSASDLAIREALSNGAKGFLEKTSNLAEFIEAMRAMSEGRVYLSAAVAMSVHRMSGQPSGGAASAELSECEREVLRCMAEGLPSKAIAARLGISIRTVGNHRGRISQKTGLSSIAQLTLHAMRLGLLGAPPPSR